MTDEPFVDTLALSALADRRLYTDADVPAPIAERDIPLNDPQGFDPPLSTPPYRRPARAEQFTTRYRR